MARQGPDADLADELIETGEAKKMDDDFLFDLNVQLHQLMRQKHIKSELRIRNGQHNWEYWHQAIRMALPFASRNFF